MTGHKTKNDNEQHPPGRHIPKWLIFLIILALLIAALFLHRSIRRSRLEDKLQAYRDAGLPATAEELEKWASYPPPEENAALKLLEAVSLFVNWDEKPLPNDPNLHIMFPLLNLNPSTALVDSPPEDWDRKNLHFLPVVGSSRMPEPGEILNKKTRRYILEFLDDNAQALQLLHEAVKLKQSRFPIDYSKDFNAQSHEPMDFFVNLREAAKWLRLETFICLENRRPDPATQSIVTSFSLVRTLHREPILIMKAGGILCSDLAISNLEYALNRCQLNHTQLNDIAAAISQVQSAPGLPLALMGERCYTSSARNSQDFKSEFPISQIFGLMDMDHLRYLEYMDQYIAASKLPLPDRLKVVTAFEEDEKSFFSRFRFLRGNNLGRDNMLNDFLKRDIFHHAQLNTARTALAAEYYRLDHQDQLPTSLTDLMPDYLDAVPIDPYDGQPIKYKIVDAGYIVYSIGEDKTDDDGQEKDASGDMYTPGPDIIFTVIRKNESK